MIALAPRRRAAMTLLEVLTVISVTGVLLSTTAALMARVAGVHRRMQSSVQQDQQRRQLAGRLRRDAHRALHADVSAAGDLLQLQLAEELAEYRLADGRLTRTAADVAGGAARLDEASWPDGVWSLSGGLIEFVPRTPSSRSRFVAAVGIAAAGQLGLRPAAGLRPEPADEPLLPPLEELP